MTDQDNQVGMEEKSATTPEILVYGSGTILNGLITATYALLTPLMVLVLGMNPILAGLIISVKTLWDGITDPFMASITDNARTRWGRRRPFILVGGVLTILLCVGIWTFIPVGDDVKPNVAVDAGIEQPAAEVADATQTVEKTGASTASEPDKNGEVLSDEAPAKPVIPPKPKKKSTWESIKAGSQVLSGTSEDQKKTFYFLLITLMMLATTHTVYSVPYFALGIELSPDYHGRTRVVCYRSIFQKILALVQPWYLPFCMMAIFANAIVGMKWLMIILACFALPSAIAASVYTRERTQVDKSQKKVNLFVSIGTTLKNKHFLKVAALYIVLQLTMGIFLQFGLYINVFHVFGGDHESAMKFGALMQAKVGTLAGILVLLSIPAVNWMCKKFQKHNALRIALVMTGAGCFLNWFLYTPSNPNLQYILPFFFSLGISSTYTVLSTLMADVTDIDELNTGSRREGMFGAVMAWMSKAIGTLQGLAVGALLVSTGFNAQALSQSPETILKMRILFSFIPAIIMGLALLLLYRYPLTRERMAEIKELIEQRKQNKAAAESNTSGE